MKQIGKIFGSPLFDEDQNEMVYCAPDGTPQCSSSADLRGWHIHVLLKYDMEFKLEHDVMGVEWIKQQYSLAQLIERYAKVALPLITP